MSLKSFCIKVGTQLKIGAQCPNRATEPGSGDIRHWHLDDHHKVPDSPGSDSCRWTSKAGDHRRQGAIQLAILFKDDGDAMSLAPMMLVMNHFERPPLGTSCHPP